MKERPLALLLGDSIRMSYQPQVKVTLESRGKASVVGPQENCRYSAYALERLDAWLEALGTPDIVHWNNGLHDVGYDPPRNPVQFPIDEYRSNLERIIERLSKTGARIVFATTTPVHPKMPFRNDSWSWKNEEIEAYNRAAIGIMNAHKIPINDLHAIVAADPDALLGEDQLHLNANGQKACAKAVVDAIEKYLP